MTPEDSALIRSNDDIDWVLSRPSMSSWLKEALKTARDRDPIDVLNDLEILNHILRTRSNACIQAFEKGANEGR
jgi:hypothetical protein